MFELKPYYTYKQIDYMLDSVRNANYSDTAFNVYKRYKKFYIPNEEYINLFLEIQNTKKFRNIPRELWEYILELKYNIFDKNDLGVLILFREMVLGQYMKGVNSLYNLNLYVFPTEFISHNQERLKDYYFTIGLIYLDCGYYLHVCVDKNTNKFFYKLCGGDFHSYFDNENTAKTLNKNPKYKDYLFSIETLIDKLQKFYLSKCLNCDQPYNIREDILQFNI